MIAVRWGRSNTRIFTEFHKVTDDKGLRTECGAYVDSANKLFEVLLVSEPPKKEGRVCLQCWYGITARMRSKHREPA